MRVFRMVNSGEVKHSNTRNTTSMFLTSGTHFSSLGHRFLGNPDSPIRTSILASNLRFTRDRQTFTKPLLFNGSKHKDCQAVCYKGVSFETKTGLPAMWQSLPKRNTPNSGTYRFPSDTQGQTFVSVSKKDHTTF